MLPKEDFCPFICRIIHNAAARLCLNKGKWCCVVHLYFISIIHEASVYNVTSNLTRDVSKEATCWCAQIALSCWWLQSGTHWGTHEDLQIPQAHYFFHSAIVSVVCNVIAQFSKTFSSLSHIHKHLHTPAKVTSDSLGQSPKALHSVFLPISTVSVYF